MKLSTTLPSTFLFLCSLISSNVIARTVPNRLSTLPARQNNKNGQNGGNNGNNNGGNTGNANTGNNNAGNNGGGDAQTSLTLDPGVIADKFAQDGQDPPVAGQVASLTSTNNFINFCLLSPNLPLTNGQQVEGGSCNPCPIGVIPSSDNMPSAKFAVPANGDTIQANKAFTMQLNIKNIITGNFVNAQANYFAAPQQVQNGQIVGHSHVVIEAIDSLTTTKVSNPKQFAFFKGLNDPANNGVLTADVTDGLDAGAYRMCTINSSSNHQPVIVPIAQHGSLDDCVYFTAAANGGGGNGGNNNANGGTNGAVGGNAGQNGGNTGQNGGNAGQNGGNAGQNGGNTGQNGGNAGQNGGNTGQNGGNAGQTGATTSQAAADASQTTANAGQTGGNNGQNGGNTGQNGGNTGQNGGNAGQTTDQSGATATQTAADASQTTANAGQTGGNTGQNGGNTGNNGGNGGQNGGNTGQGGRGGQGGGNRRGGFGFGRGNSRSAIIARDN